MTSSPSISAQVSNPLFDVMIIEVFSYSSLTRLKNRFASFRSIGVYPISSIIPRSDFRIRFILNPEKNEELKRERNISFEQIVFHLS